MIGIAKYYSRLYIVTKLTLVYGLYAADGADRHKNGCDYIPVTSREGACTGIRTRGCGVKCELHRLIYAEVECKVNQSLTI